ncbi:MAG: ABC transporter permease [Chloroflexota bacterium]|nr:ABC transporter permease [Chloroflexota bacterium]
MHAFIITRIARGVPVLVVVSLLVFGALHILPGDPFLASQGTQVTLTAEDLAKLRAEVGLDQPFYVQYLRWVVAGLQGDLGVSYYNQRRVTDLVALRLPATLELTFVALVLALAIAVPAGILAAVRRGSPLDYLVTGIGTIGMSLPGFWLGIMMILLFSVHLGWFPAVGFEPLLQNPVENLKHIVLPACTLGFILVAPTMRVLRSSTLDVIRQDYVQTARAKGLPEWIVILRHVLKAALIPTLTIVGLQLGYLLGGSVIIEWVFGWPGLGQLTVESIKLRDYAVVQSTVMLFALGFILINLTVDLLYGVLDPRIGSA